MLHSLLKALLEAFLRALLWISPAKCTGLFPWIGSQPEGSAEQRNCVSNPMRLIASSTFRLRAATRAAASQEAPHGAPLITFIREILPSLNSTSNSGAPNRSPYKPRQTCLDNPHQVGGVRASLDCSFFPEATIGMFLSRHLKARSCDRSGCFKKSRTRSASMSSGRYF